MISSPATGAAAAARARRGSVGLDRWRERLLIAKYNREQIEYRAGRWRVRAWRPANARTPTTRPLTRAWRVGPICACASAAPAATTAPRKRARVIGPECSIDFGVTRIYPLEGDWPAGLRHLQGLSASKRATSAQPDFDPPAALERAVQPGLARRRQRHAAGAARTVCGGGDRRSDIGAEALLLRPDLGSGRGQHVWDEARLGPLDDVRRPPCASGTA